MARTAVSGVKKRGAVSGVKSVAQFIGSEKRGAVSGVKSVAQFRKRNPFHIGQSQCQGRGRISVGDGVVATHGHNAFSQ